MKKHINMASPATYRICVQGRIPDSWEEWFDDTSIHSEPDQEDPPWTILVCRVRDQAALLGVLMSLNGLNAPLISISMEESGENPGNDETQGEIV